MSHHKSINESNKREGIEIFESSIFSRAILSFSSTDFQVDSSIMNVRILLQSYSGLKNYPTQANRSSPTKGQLQFDRQIVVVV